MVKITSRDKDGKRSKVKKSYLKVGKGYLNIQGWQRVPKGPRLANGTQWSKVGKGFIKVHRW